MTDAPYPDPIPRSAIANLVDHMIANGYIDPTKRELMIERHHIKHRLRRWLIAMGVEPTLEARRAYVEQRRRAFHDQRRAENERKGNP